MQRRPRSACSFPIQSFFARLQNRWILLNLSTNRRGPDLRRADWSGTLLFAYDVKHFLRVACQMHCFTYVFSALMDSIGCSHLRANELFTESINSSCRFKAYPCSSAGDFKANRCHTCRSRCTTMGYETDKSKRGTFYFTTASSSPYCLQ